MGVSLPYSAELGGLGHRSARKQIAGSRSLSRTCPHVLRALHDARSVSRESRPEPDLIIGSVLASDHAVTRSMRPLTRIPYSPENVRAEISPGSLYESRGVVGFGGSTVR